MSSLAVIGVGDSTLYFTFVLRHKELTKRAWKGRNFRKIIFWTTLGVSVLVVVPGGVLKGVFLDPSGRGPATTGPGPLPLRRLSDLLLPPDASHLRKNYCNARGIEHVQLQFVLWGPRSRS